VFPSALDEGKIIRVRLNEIAPEKIHEKQIQGKN
jgi:hypothetical protein